MDFNTLGDAAAKADSMSRAIVPGRVLQYDADFACYEVSDLEETTAQSFRRLLDHIEMKRCMAGAEHVNAHITLGTKSGREIMATVQEYQKDRDPDAPIKPRIRELRSMLANELLAHNRIQTLSVIWNLHYEADDMMVILQHARIKSHGWHSSVIMSGDKDLWMGQGYHCDPKTGKLYLVKGYGKTEYREVGNIKPKLIGEGRSWFWHQMIMGDKADSIPGLEKISNVDLDTYTPLKSNKPRKPGSGLCGETKAVVVLKNVTTDKEAAIRTYSLYCNYYGIQAGERFIEQAYLLWMQRNYDPFDVVNYLAYTCKLAIRPTREQYTKMLAFKDLVNKSVS